MLPFRNLDTLLVSNCDGEPLLRMPVVNTKQDKKRQQISPSFTFALLNWKMRAHLIKGFERQQITMFPITSLVQVLTKDNKLLMEESMAKVVHKTSKQAEMQS